MRCSKVAGSQPRATPTPSRLGKQRVSPAQLLSSPMVLGRWREVMGDRRTSDATALQTRRPLADVNDVMERSRLAWARLAWSGRRSYSPRKTMQPPTDRVASNRDFSLRFARIPVNTAGSHGPRALRGESSAPRYTVPTSALLHLTPGLTLPLMIFDDIEIAAFKSGTPQPSERAPGR
jgi:hypothetical protein